MGEERRELGLGLGIRSVIRGEEVESASYPVWLGWVLDLRTECALRLLPGSC